MIRAWTRRLLVAMAAAVLVVSVAACGSSGNDIPDFQPGPGKFRVVPQPTHGAPPPQVIHFKGHRLLAFLLEVTRSGAAPTASMSFLLGEAEPPLRKYRSGDHQTVGPVTIKIDGIYGSGDQDIAVDITLTVTTSSPGSS